MAVVRHSCNLLRQQRWRMRAEHPLGRIARASSAEESLLTDAQQAPARPAP